MPDDTKSAPTVTDPALLRLANAGPNWRCAYCGSDQRRLDGECAQCGAAQSAGRSVVGERAPVPPAYPAPSGARRPRTSHRTWITVIGSAVGCAGLLLLGCCVAATMRAPQPSYDEASSVVEAPAPPRIVEGVVTRVAWEHTIRIERRQLVDGDGFAEARPADALEVSQAGERVHHHDRVQDGTETEHYTERVPYQDTETYTEQERCGESCTDNPRHCTEDCRPDDNGFATCTTTCTGGGQTCSPRYCPVSRTRMVTRYRDEPRTRQVPRYREVPRYAPWFRWRVWSWVHDREVVHRGSTETPTWPTDAELQPPAPLGPGESERQSRSTSYTAFLAFDGQREHRETLAAEAELARFAPGTRWQLEVPFAGGAARLLGPAITADLDSGAD